MHLTHYSERHITIDSVVMLLVDWQWQLVGRVCEMWINSVSEADRYSYY